jgi:hypothetical protein
MGPCGISVGSRAEIGILHASPPFGGQVYHAVLPTEIPQGPMFSKILGLHNFRMISFLAARRLPRILSFQCAVCNMYFNGFRAA